MTAVPDDRIWFTIEAVSYELTVRDPATDELVDLSGMTPAARARASADPEVIVGAITVTGLGKATVQFAPGVLAPGKWFIQHHMTPAGGSPAVLRPATEIMIITAF